MAMDTGEPLSILFLRPGAQIVLTHMARTLCAPHAELEERLRPEGIVPAYDGMRFPTVRSQVPPLRSPRRAGKLLHTLPTQDNLPPHPMRRSNALNRRTTMALEPLDPRKWEAVQFPEHPHHDTIWSITLDHDGQVYLGLCLEGKGGGVAQVYSYDTKARQLRHLADMGEVTGEVADSGHATQGKIHFSLCHATDGKLYGATHCTTPPMGHRIWSSLTMWGDPAMSFPGGHIFRYDTRNGECVDFGAIFPNDGIPYLMLDEGRGRLYGVTFPKAHFFRSDLAGRNVVDYGRVSSWYPISMVFDEAGNLYFSDMHSQLIKYDVAQDRVVYLGTKPYTVPWNTDSRWSWVTDMCLASDGWVYGVPYSNDHLFRFDPRQERPVIEDLGPGLPTMDGGALRCLVPDRQGSLYYVTCQVRGGTEGNVLTRYALATGERTPVGLMSLNDQSHSVWRGVCDADGTLYFACVGRAPTNMLIYRP